MKRSRLALVILAVSDLSRSKQFYLSAFGGEVAVDVPVYVEFNLPEGMRLGLYAATSFGLNTGRSVVPAAQAPLTTRTELYLYPEDLQEAIAAVTAAGGETLSALAGRSWGDDAAYFTDPDGNVIALARQSQG
jgi:predicted enzyme related to lactoylglutathione lyase